MKRKLQPLECLCLLSRAASQSYRKIEEFIKKSQITLKKLHLDCDEIDNDELIDILQYLDPLIIKDIQFSHCEGFNDHIVNNISKFTNITSLKIRKARYISQQSLGALLEDKSFKYLNLDGCEKMGDQSILNCLYMSPFLQEINLNWIGSITNQSISFMFQKCIYLKNASLMGCKGLNDQCLPQIYEISAGLNENQFHNLRRQKQNISFSSIQEIVQYNIDDRVTLYKNLKKLNFDKCDFVQDQILILLKLFRRRIKITNYYGQDIEYLFQ